ncbi:T9SS type A sorting domain-containing protein [Membranihabitans marinus]|uniref:T9SS type A sorting domain-containing protein n=1 Tax=Membranihabitans marinus TaxID=1227546 RepID=UPI001F288ED5|nr:T9SS type A sorting domain-containing protein [Membranihabitans marinus]
MKRIIYLTSLVILISCYALLGQNPSQSFGPGVYEELNPQIRLRASCVPSPNQDYEYNFNQSFEANVNAAIARERSAFRNNNIDDYVHPETYTDPRDYAQKIITALRKAYSSAYNIPTVSIPLHPAINNAAQNHSCRMISCGEFNHQSSCLGSPSSRISEQVGDWGTCFNGYSENIAINTLSSVEAAIEWAVFGMMYDDLSCCNNGHRENFLNCSFDNSWYLGFGFQRGKFSFGQANRSYDTWFLTWDYAKKTNQSNCSWDEDNGSAQCPETNYTAFQSFSTTGSNNCSSVEIQWSTKQEAMTSSFEVYVANDNGNYSVIENINAKGSPSSYSAVYSPTGNTSLSIYVKAIESNGSFVSTSPHVLQLDDCEVDNTPSEESNTPEETEEPNEEVSEPSNPTEPSNPAESEEPETSNPVVDNQDIIVVPNPASSYISLSNVDYGSIYIIYNMSGRPLLIGYYTNRINISRLSSGQYIIATRTQVGKFVKQ